MQSISLRHIVISGKNYNTLKNLGKAGDSFNDVLNMILKKLEARNE